MAISDDSGGIVEAYSYDPYGQTKIFDQFGNLTTTSTVNNSYAFIGRRLDFETGLYYYRARYYDASIGRFLQSDPIGYGNGMNMYAYVGNNPINLFDPFGLSKEKSYSDDFWEGVYSDIQNGKNVVRQ